MIDLDVVIRSKKTVDQLSQMDRALLFAMEEALNDTSFGMRKGVFLPAVRRSFDLSNNFLTKGLRPGAKGPGGIGVLKAKATDLRSKVFFGEGTGFLELHQEGKTKLPPTGSPKFFVPDESLGKKRVRKGQLVLAAALRSSGASGGRNLFIIGEGTNRERLVERSRIRVAGKGVRRDRRGWVTGRSKIRSRDLTVLGWMEPKAKIKKVLSLSAPARGYAATNLPKNFDKRLDRRLKKIARS